MNCPKCGAELDDHGRFCRNCGLEITSDTFFGDDNRAERKALRCPNCGVSDFSIINEVNTTGKDYSFAKGCCCSLLFLYLFGLFCGFCGKGKTTTNTMYYVCNNCGKKWRA